MIDRTDRDVAAAIDEWGRSVTLRQHSADSYDPLTDTETGGANTDTPISAAILEYKKREIDGKRVVASDRKAVITARGLAVTPAVGDLMLDDSVQWRILDVATRRKGDVVLSYVCQLRGA